MGVLECSLRSLPSSPATMFAARVRASLKPFLHGRHSSSLNRNREIVTSSRRVVLDRYSDGYGNLSNGVRTKLSHREIQFHSSSPRCYSSESDVVGEKAQATLDDFFSELGSVKKDRNRKAVVVELLTKKPDTFQVEKLEPSHLPTLKKKIRGKKKKKHEQASDSVSKPKLLTEKPEASWKTNGKSKAETRASSKPTESPSPVQDHESNAQSIISPSSESRNETSSNVSSISDDTLSSHSSSVLVIRISNLNSKTTDLKIHSMCLSIGSLEGVARVNEDSVNVSFRARNMNEAKSILEKLNEATVDHSQWRAEVVPEAEEASKDQIGMRINSSFEDMKKQLMMRQILVKDLEILVNSLAYLENHPMAPREGTNA